MRWHEHEFSIAAMSRVLSVSRPGYHAWERCRLSARASANETLRVEIRALHVQSRSSYGSRRVRRQLLRQGHRVSRHRAARIMSHEGSRAKRSPRSRVTTDSRNAKVIHEYLFARDFAIAAPNRAWAGDITYLWSAEGRLYLAVVLDIGTRRVIGWYVRETLAAELATAALDMALGVRPTTPGGICHSDQGSQSGSGDVQAIIKRYQPRGSMSCKGNCWDNAVAESFFGSLKTELLADARWLTRAESKSAVVGRIEGWYNRERLHSTLDYLSPDEFECQIATETQ